MLALSIHYRQSLALIGISVLVCFGKLCKISFFPHHYHVIIIYYWVLLIYGFFIVIISIIVPLRHQYALDVINKIRSNFG